jgi:hypothetical protein
MILARLVQSYGTVLVPFGDGCRYDLVVEIEGKFQRVQCKTGRLRDGTVVFKTCSIVPGTGKSRAYTDEIDLFGIYCLEIDQVYLVPVGDVGGVEGRLRIDPTLNNQSRGVRWAKNYVVHAAEAQSG